MPPSDELDRITSQADREDDPGEDLEAMIERADHAFAAESFGTTAEEQARGSSLDRRLWQEQAEASPLEVELAIEEVDGPDEEGQMIGEAVLEREPYVSPEDAAMTVRDAAPGAVDHANDEYVELYDETHGA